METGSLFKISSEGDGSRSPWIGSLQNVDGEQFRA